MNSCSKYTETVYIGTATVAHVVSGVLLLGVQSHYSIANGAVEIGNGRHRVHI